MANKRIIDLTATTTPSGYVALDHETNGTKKLDVTKIAPVDSALSSSSTNAVQNKVINTALSGKLATTGNSQNNTVAFTSGDVANDAAATSWTANVATLATGLTHANLFNRISTMMKNVRYLYNAVTKLNTDLNSYSSASVTGTYIDTSWSIYKFGKIVIFQIKELSSAPSGSFSMERAIPDGFRPRNTITDTLVVRSTNYKVLAIGIDAAGNISMYNYQAEMTTTQPVNRIMVWITN